MKTTRLLILLLTMASLMPCLLPAQSWGVEVSGGLERRHNLRIPDPGTSQLRLLHLRQYDLAPGIWWSKRGPRFMRVRLQYSMLRGDLPGFGASSVYDYRESILRNTTLVGAAVGGGWQGSWRFLDWRLGFEGGFARTVEKLLLISQVPGGDLRSTQRETMSAHVAELQGGMWADLALRLGERVSLGLEQRIAVRWLVVSGAIADDFTAFNAWRVVQAFGPEQLALPRLWLRMSF